MVTVSSELVCAAMGLVAAQRRAILGIAGVPGAGKSTLVELLLAEIQTQRGDDWVAHLPMDGFHLADAQLDRLGRRDRKGAPETFDVAGFAHTLGRVSAGEPDVYVPGFERDLEQPIAAALVIPESARLIVTEGNYLLLEQPEWRSARAHLTRTWFVSGDSGLRVQRLIQRHVRFGKNPREAEEWVLRSDEANARLVAPSVAAADLVIVNDGDFRSVPNGET